MTGPEHLKTAGICANAWQCWMNREWGRKKKWWHGRIKKLTESCDQRKSYKPNGSGSTVFWLWWRQFSAYVQHNYAAKIRHGFFSSLVPVFIKERISNRGKTTESGVNWTFNRHNATTRGYFKSWWTRGLYWLGANGWGFKTYFIDDRIGNSQF